MMFSLLSHKSKVWSLHKNSGSEGDKTHTYAIFLIWPVDCGHMLWIKLSAPTSTVSSRCRVQHWSELLSCCSVHFLRESVCWVASFNSPDTLQNHQEKQ